MQTLPISVVKNQLNDLVEQAMATHEQVEITKNGMPAAFLVSADEWDSMNETLFWLSQENIAEDIKQADEEYARGETLSTQQVRELLESKRNR